ncbi:MAG: DUF3365 domain-containing protein [Cytophagaceae bacterium]
MKKYSIGTGSIILIFMFIGLVACDGTVDTRGISEEIQKRKIQRVTEADLMNLAQEKGQKIVDSSMRMIFKTLDSLTKAGNISTAIPYCSEVRPQVKSIGDFYGAHYIRRTSLKIRNPENKPDSLEISLLDSYEFNKENNLELSSNLQSLKKGSEILFTSPIIIPSGICLNCHGNPDKEITPEVLAEIRKKYPEDKAVNYQVGDLRGMWSIRFLRKDLLTR